VPRFFLTTAIDYVNSRPHLGTAYEKIAADVIARYKRLAGVDVRFVMGNDEHSQNVYKKAREACLDPVVYCDRMEKEFRDVWRRLNISFDDFIRTTEARHARAVQKMAQRSFDAGDIYEGEYEGWYCISCEAFKQDKDLVDGLCPIHRTKPEWIKERNYFFRLSAFRDRLLAHYASHPDFIQPESRRNEILRLVEAGLEDISVSRAGQSWGIPLPFDPASVAYVWYDALINYAAAVGYGTDDEMFETWWPANLHVIGKDITRFHGVIWPAMLMSAGIAIPRQVFGHGWVTFRGEKMSKSLGTIIDPLEAADRLGADPLRWYLTREISFGQDGDFSWDLFEKSYNADLANNLGNLVNRVTSMAHRYRGGVITGPGNADSVHLRTALATLPKYAEAMEAYRLSEAGGIALSFSDAANATIADAEPWKLAKAGHDAELDAVLWDAAEALRLAAVLLSPFMPDAATEILKRVDASPRASGLRLDSDGGWQSSGRRIVSQGPLLWPRLEAGTTTEPKKETRVTELPKDIPPTPPAPTPPVAAAAVPAPAPVAADTRVSIDEFMKIELRVAKVLAAERVPNSKKLMKLVIELGAERRTIVAGIAEAYEADALVGRLVGIVANLKPAKLMGIESNGMILAASTEGGKPMLIAFDGEPPTGARIR
jgi:methionyl-tRNA synthetase